MTQITTLTIQNKKGLHARAAALFVKEAEKYESEIWVEKDDQRVSASYIMELMLLVASQGSTIRITANGVDEKEAIQGLTNLVNQKFFEE